MHQTLVKQVVLFAEISPAFIMKIIGKLKPREILGGENLYSQGDTADEIYFITSGSFNLLVDISTMVDFQLEREKVAFNVPFIRIQNSGYFGDQECLTQHTKLFPSLMNQQVYRYSTALAHINSAQILVLKRLNLMPVLKEFPSIKTQMQ